MINASAILLAANELGKQHAGFTDILKTMGLGVGTVFVGLVCIIFICKIMSFIVQKLESGKKPASAPAAPAAASAPASIENRGALSAAIAAAVAEEMGTDVSGIRIVSIKRK